MQLGFNILIAAALASVAIIVALGFINMVRAKDSKQSQKLMRARVIMQAVAVLLIFLAFAFANKG